MTMNINNARMIDDAQLLQVAGGTDLSGMQLYLKGDMVYFYARVTLNGEAGSGELRLGTILQFHEGEYLIASGGTAYIVREEDIESLAAEVKDYARLA